MEAWTYPGEQVQGSGGGPKGPPCLLSVGLRTLDPGLRPGVGGSWGYPAVIRGSAMEGPTLLVFKNRPGRFSAPLTRGGGGGGRQGRPSRGRCRPQLISNTSCKVFTTCVALCKHSASWLGWVGRYRPLAGGWRRYRPHHRDGVLVGFWPLWPKWSIWSFLAKMVKIAILVILARDGHFGQNGQSGHFGPNGSIWCHFIFCF